MKNNYSFTPLSYPGGKSQYGDEILKILHANSISKPVFYELYAGGAGLGLALLLNNHISHLALNDIDPMIAHFWQCVFNHTEELCSAIEACEITINEWNKQRDVFFNPQNYTSFEQGFALFFLNRCNFSGIIKSTPRGGKKQDGICRIHHRFYKEKAIKIIQVIATQRHKITITNQCAISILRSTPPNDQNVFFLDPPYYELGQKLYTYYFKKNQHQELYDTLNNSPHYWLLTYNNHDIIKNLYHGFIQRKYKAQNSLFHYNASYKASTQDKREIFIFSKNLRDYQPQHQYNLFQSYQGVGT